VIINAHGFVLAWGSVELHYIPLINKWDNANLKPHHNTVMLVGHAFYAQHFEALIWRWISGLSTP